MSLDEKNWPHQKNRANSISNPSKPEGVKFRCVYTPERTNTFKGSSPTGLEICKKKVFFFTTFANFILL